jgi:hypothetical protein
VDFGAAGKRSNNRAGCGQAAEIDVLMRGIVAIFPARGKSSPTFLRLLGRLDEYGATILSHSLSHRFLALATAFIA